jgi:membrane protein
MKRAVKDAKEDRITLTGAGMAFYWFLAIFPLLIAAVGLLALVHASPSFLSGLRGAIGKALPSGAASVLTQALSSAQHQVAGGLTALIVGVAIAVYSASSGMAAAEEGLDVAYDVPESRKFVKKRLVAIGLTVIMLVLGGVGMALLVFGQPLGSAIERVMPLGGAFAVVWTIVRWAVAIAALITLFAVFYYLGPNRKPPHWSWVSPGGVVALVIWLLASVGFSFYVSAFGTYGKTYGSLAGVVVLLLWLWLSALALLFGAEVNGELEREKALRDRGDQKPDTPASRLKTVG